MPEFYEDGQVKSIFHYVPYDVDWFIIGGPADANEAQIFKEKYPECQVVGFEPNPEMYRFQCDHDFPGELNNKALWSTETVLKFWIPNENNRCGTFRHIPTNNVHDIETCTLDKYFEYKEINNAVLWIDIEGSELECLKGCERLLNEKKIALINVEVFNESRDEIYKFLMDKGYKHMLGWNIRDLKEGRIVWDSIFTR